MKRYGSKLDAWAAVALLIAPVVSVVTVAMAMTTGEVAVIATGWGMLLLVIGLYAVMVLPISYELHPTALVVRFGLLRRRAPYHRIRSVAPSRSILASPSLSFDRVEVRYDGAPLPLLISPEPRAEFLAELDRRTPHLRLDVDRLIPA